MDTNRS